MNIIQNKTIDISELFQPIQSNNTGEAQKSSSSSGSFDKVLSGLFPHHPNNTSQEARKANETSPDYSKDNTTKDNTKEDFNEKDNEIKNNDNFDSLSSKKNEAKYDENTNKSKKSENNNEDEVKKSEKSQIVEDNSNEMTKSKEVNKEDKSVNEEDSLSEDDVEKVEKTVSKLQELLEKIIDIFEKYLSNDNNENIDQDEFSEKIKNFLNSKEFASIKEGLEGLKSLLNENKEGSKLDILKQLFNDLFNGSDLNLKLDKLEELNLQIDESIYENNDSLTNIKDIIDSFLELNSNKTEVTSIEDDNSLNKFFEALSNVITEEKLSSVNNEEIKLSQQPVTKTPLKEGLILDDNMEKQERVIYDVKTSTEVKPDDVLKIQNIKSETDLIKEIIAGQNSEMAKPQLSTSSNNSQAEATPLTDIKTIGAESSAKDLNAKSDLNQSFFPEKSMDETKSMQQTGESKANQRFTSFLDKAFESERQVIDKIITQANLKMTATTKELTFTLEPPELGKVRINIIDENGTISGKIRVDSDVIKEIVMNNIGQLRQALNQNLKVDKLEVEVRPDSEQARDLDYSKESSEGEKRENRNDSNYEDDDFYNDVLKRNYALNIPIPKGVNIKTDGLLSVDLIF